MIITKEVQGAMVLNYKSKFHSVDECLGFADGLIAMLNLVSKKPIEDNVIIVWSDGTYKSVLNESAWEYESDENYLVTIPLR